MIGLDIHDARIVPDDITRDAIKKLRGYIWKPRFSIRKRRCFLSGETIPWFTAAYKGTYRIDGPPATSPLIITKWATPEAVVFQKLKGIIV